MYSPIVVLKAFTFGIYIATNDILSINEVFAPDFKGAAILDADF